MGFIHTSLVVLFGYPVNCKYVYRSFQPLYQSLICTIWTNSICIHLWLILYIVFEGMLTYGNLVPIWNHVLQYAGIKLFNVKIFSFLGQYVIHSMVDRICSRSEIVSLSLSGSFGTSQSWWRHRKFLWISEGETSKRIFIFF